MAKSAKPKSSAKPETQETSEQRFVRLTNKRVTKAMNDIRLIGNLAKYAHTQEQADRIQAALDEAYNDVQRRFAIVGKPEKPTFQL